MDILFVTRPIAPPWNEGSKNLTWQLASRMTCHTPYLLTVQGKSLPSFSRELIEYPIYSEQKLTLTQKLRLFSFLLLRLPPVDILHFFFVPTPLTSRLLSIVTRVHGKTAVQTIPSLPTTPTSEATLKRLLFADSVVVYSRFTEDYLRQWHVPNVTRIPAGIETERFAHANPDVELRFRFNLPEDAILLLFSGEYSRLGSINVLMKILPEVIKKCPNCHFLIACRILIEDDIQVERQFKQYVADNNLEKQVHFVGEVSDFSALLKASDMFLFPVSEMTGKIDMPLTVLEAMAAGLPIVSCNMPPLDEIFTSDMDSIVDAGDNEAMISAILSLAAHPQKRLEQGVGNQERMLQEYDLNVMVKKYEALYDSFS